MTDTSQARRALAFASANHVWSDLFFIVFVPLLPLIKSDPDFDLSFTEIALLKATWSGTSAVLQVPAGFAAERVSEFWLLIGGNLWVAVALVIMALAPGYRFLLTVAAVGGLGGGTQHPLATSMVSRAYEEGGRATAVGTVNFAGDLGKMAGPAAAFILPASFGWRSTMRVLGLAGIAFVISTAVFRRKVDVRKPAKDSHPETDGDGVDSRGYTVLTGVGFLDSGLRGAALAFLPFLLQDKGFGQDGIYLMIALLLAGGAAGKFVCGWLSDRIGFINVVWSTKGLTALLLVAVLPTPTFALIPLFVILGIGLQGTSSALYAAVSTFVPPGRRARMYGYFYTTNEVGAFLMPLLVGRIADLRSLRAAMVAMGAIAALILPASLPLRRRLDAPPATVVQHDP